MKRQPWAPALIDRGVMKRVPTVLLTLSIAISLFAAPSARAAAPTSVPIRLQGTEAPVVKVRIQGKEVPLQLDLGDESSLVLHPEILDALRSEATGVTFKGVSMDGAIETPVVRLDLVEIGALKLSGVAARKDVHDETFLAVKKNAVGALGFIGAGLFKSGQIRLDYERMQLTVSLPGDKGSVRNICRGRKVPFVMNGYGFTTPVSTDVGELQMTWDTGSPAVLVSQAAAAAAQLDARLESTQSRKFVIAGEDFGPQRIEIWSNIPLPEEIDGLIGHPFFQRHVVCFDYPNRMLHVR